MCRHELARDPQTETEAGVVSLGDGALEALEDALVVVFADADAVILAAHDDMLADRLAAHRDRLRRAVFHGIREQVRDDLLEPLRVEAAGAGERRDHGQLAARARRVLGEAVARVAYQRSQVDVFEDERDAAIR